jgi:hypothetical protein
LRAILSNGFAIWCCFTNHEFPQAFLFKIFHSIIDKLFTLRIGTRAAFGQTGIVVSLLPKQPDINDPTADLHPANQCQQQSDKFTIHLNQ